MLENIILVLTQAGSERWIVSICCEKAFIGKLNAMLCFIELIGLFTHKIRNKPIAEYDMLDKLNASKEKLRNEHYLSMTQDQMTGVLLDGDSASSTWNHLEVLAYVQTILLTHQKSFLVLTASFTPPRGFTSRIVSYSNI